MSTAVVGLRPVDVSGLVELMAFGEPVEPEPIDRHLFDDVFYQQLQSRSSYV